jgi:hypothetical protein
MAAMHNKRKKIPRQNDLEKLRERVANEKDLDIKRGLKKGNTVDIRADSMN